MIDYKVPILMGAGSDVLYGVQCARVFKKLGIGYAPRVVSAHKRTVELLSLLEECEKDDSILVLLGIIGRSNALTPISDFNLTKPVVVYHATAEQFPYDIWSSLRVPSGIAHGVTMYPDSAALLCAKIIAGHDPDIKERVRAYIAGLREKNRAEDNAIATQIELKIAELEKG